MVSAQPLLRAPHGFAELTFPEEPPITRCFFETCADSRDFPCAASEREQFHWVHRWACENHPEKLSLQQIADLFQLAMSTVARHLRKPVDSGVARSPCRNGRPSLLTEEQLTALRRFIEERFASRYPVSYEDCRAFLLGAFDLATNIKFLRSLIQRTDAFNTVGEPMEDSLNFCDPSDYYYARLHYVLRTSCLPSLCAVIACSACVSASSCGLAPPLLRSLFLLRDLTIILTSYAALYRSKARRVIYLSCALSLSCRD